MEQVLDFLTSFRPEPAADPEPEAGAAADPEPEAGAAAAAPVAEPDWEALAETALQSMRTILEPRLGHTIEFSPLTRRALAEAAQASGAAYFGRMLEMIRQNYPVVMLGIFAMSVFADIRRARQNEDLHREERSEVHEEPQGASEIHKGPDKETAQA